jgi:hypothetical protein
MPFNSNSRYRALIHVSGSFRGNEKFQKTASPSPRLLNLKLPSLLQRGIVQEKLAFALPYLWDCQDGILAPRARA